MSSFRFATRLLRVTAAGIPLVAGAQRLPDRLSDSEFWRLVTTYSEPGGFFRSDNFVSNETAFQYVIPRLQSMVAPGGVYLGVGPDQNFTYIAATKPAIAFVFDIRRQNVIQHLMYKALLEASQDRVDFVSRLFSRPRPAGLGTDAHPESLFAAVARADADTLRFAANLRAMFDRLGRAHGFSISPEDSASLTYVYTSFFLGGPALSYSFGRGSNNGPWGGGRRGMPSFADLQVFTDDGEGQNHAYLASERAFRVIKDLTERNLIVPLVGDFGGDSAIRKVGQWLRARNAPVSMFYTSNVEQYLFQSDAWRRYYANVATLPLSDSATFIRAVFNMGGYATQLNAMRSASLLSPIPALLAAFREERITSYWDVIQMSR